MKRRTFLKGMALTAAGILAPKPGLVDAEEVRRFWTGWSSPNDLRYGSVSPRGFHVEACDVCMIDEEIVFYDGRTFVRGFGGTERRDHHPQSTLYILGPAT